MSLKVDLTVEEMKKYLTVKYSLSVWKTCLPWLNTKTEMSVKPYT